jgi:hypothetical protein
LYNLSRGELDKKVPLSYKVDVRTATIF